MQSNACLLAFSGPPAGFYISMPAIKHFRICWRADKVVPKIFHFVFVLSFNIRSSRITRMHNQLRKHTLSLKSSPNWAPGPARMHGPCRQTRKALECGACFFVKHRQSPALTFVSALHTLSSPRHAHPTPPSPLPRQLEPEGAGAGETGPPGDSKPALTKDKHK